MKFENPMVEGVLLRRYKRFLADIRLSDGSQLTVHCPNPGAMMGLDAPGNRVFISDSQNPKRKLRYTLELVEVHGNWVGVNTNRPNTIAREAIDAGLIDVPATAQIMAEQKYGENSRIDWLVRMPSQPLHFIEVKNVHLVRQQGLHEFPDCKTARGEKHLRELMAQIDRGNRATMVYIIQRMDGDTFTIAADLDPAYARAFVEAHHHGVEMIAIRCAVSPEAITPGKRIPVALPDLS